MVMNTMAKRVEIQSWQFASFSPSILMKPLPRAKYDFRKRTSWVRPGARVQQGPPALAFAGGVVVRFLTIPTRAKTGSENTTP
jgi:hypothetical protein